MLSNVQRESDSLWNDLVAAREAMAAAVRNEVAARARQVEEVTEHENVWTELAQVPNSLTRFHE